MAQRLLHPGVLDEGLRSGLFISGLRRTGKTTFLVTDLIPVLEAEGAVVIYVDLWSDTLASPAALVRDAIARKLAELQDPASAALRRLERLSGAEVQALGLKFGFKLDRLGAPGETTLAQALAEVVDKARTDVVLIVDEVQQAMASEDGNRMLLALKAARDAINPRPGTAGHFLFVGTGSHQALVGELGARRNQAFAGAVLLDFPVLDADYVAYLLDRLAREGGAPLPSMAVATEAFRTLGHRPEELRKALHLTREQSGAHADPDTVLPVVARTLRSAAADVELAKVEALGALAAAVFDRIATAQGAARRLFSADAAAAYSHALGREVRVEEVQKVVNALVDANLVLRRGHGLYEVADPFVQAIAAQRKALAAGS